MTYALSVIDDVNPVGIDRYQHGDVFVCQQTGEAADWLLYLTLEECCPKGNKSQLTIIFKFKGFVRRLPLNRFTAQ